jgi:hypothetical protein
VDEGHDCNDNGGAGWPSGAVSALTQIILKVHRSMVHMTFSTFLPRPSSLVSGHMLSISP